MCRDVRAVWLTAGSPAPASEQRTPRGECFLSRAATERISAREFREFTFLQVRKEPFGLYVVQLRESFRSTVSRLLCWMKVSKLSGVVCVCVCLVRVGCRWTAQWAVRGSEATADTTVHRGDLQLFSQITQWNFGTYTLLLLLFVCIILTWFIITTKLMKVSRRKQHWYASKLYLINRFTYTFCSLCRFAVFVVLCLDSTYAVSTLCLSSLKNDTSSKMHNGRIYISVCLGYISLTSLSFPKVFLRFVLKQPVGKVIVTNSSLEAYSHGQCRLLVVYLY